MVNLYSFWNPHVVLFFSTEKKRNFMREALAFTSPDTTKIQYSTELTQYLHQHSLKVLRKYISIPNQLLRILIPIESSPWHSASPLARNVRFPFPFPFPSPWILRHQQATKWPRQKAKWSPVTGFTSQLEGYESVTAQCHNCKEGGGRRRRKMRYTQGMLMGGYRW